MGFRWNKARPARLAVIVCAAVLGTLVLAPAASAASAFDQYAAPTLDDAGVIASGSSGNQGAVSGGAAGQTQAGTAGKLPFTGYPVTPLVWLIAGLLVGGLALRVTAPRLDRRRI